MQIAKQMRSFHHFVRKACEARLQGASLEESVTLQVVPQTIYGKYCCHRWSPRTNYSCHGWSALPQVVPHEYMLLL